MMRSFVAFAVLCLVTLSSAVAQEKNDPAAEAALNAARKVTTLSTVSSPSFVLQASFETFDYTGAPDGKGIMTLSSAQTRWRETFQYRDKHSAVYSTDGTRRTVSDKDYETSFALNRVVGKLFRPIPAAEVMGAYTYSQKKLKAGSVDLNCIVASLPYKGVDYQGFDAFSRPIAVKDDTNSAPNAAYCLDKDNIVRIIQGHNGLVITLNRILRFNGVFVAGDIVMTEKGKTRAHLHVDALNAVPDLSSDDLALPPADTGGPRGVSGAVLAGQVLYKEPLVYPEDAKKRHIQGTVLLHALIGKDGTVHDLELISTPDDSLADAAMAAVRKWTYRPYLVSGEPVNVDTTITCNFAFSH